MRYAIILGLILSLAGCASAPAPTYYRVDYEIPKSETRTVKYDLLLAAPPMKGPEPLSRTNITYRTTSRTLHHYQHHYWEHSPVETAHRHLIQTFRAGKVFSRLTTRRLAMEANLQLKTRLTGFEQVGQGKTAAAKVSIWFQLLETKTNRIILSEEISATSPIRPAETDDLEVLAEAMSTALKKCVNEVVADIDRVVGKIQP